MRVSILTVFPNLYDQFLKTSLIGRAIQNNILQCDVDSFFSYVEPKERIDAPTFGHRSGLLIRPDVIAKGIEAKEKTYGKAYKIFFSPQGQHLDQRLLKKVHAEIQAHHDHVMLIPSRYEGMDQRVEDHYADLVISMGDFVVMGGDIPAMLFLEGLTRLIPGVVGKQESVEQESFSGPFLDYPEYTVPVSWQGEEVPAVVRSGNHAKIDEWREERAAQKTVMTNFAWLRSSVMSDKQKEVAESYIPRHYCALLHSDIILPNDEIGTTSVTSLDIHDIARSAKTYGLKKYFIVTPLIDQQKIVTRLLDFWKSSSGIDYNKNRHDAICLVELSESLDDAIAAIEKIEGKRPIVLATSARADQSDRLITFYDQTKVWQQDRPVLIIFGTGRGMSSALIEKADFLLVPVEGFSDFNHLSVRSAVAIILDRWLGINIKNI